MAEEKKSSISIKANKPTGLSSRVYGGNVDAVAFNIDFIASKNPSLAIAILKLYKEASALKEDDPSSPEEDYSLALDEIKDLLK